MSKLTILEHLEACAERAKSYASGLVSEVAATAAGAIREIEALKADQPTLVNITIPTSGWVNGGGTTGYPYYVDISITGLTADNRVSVTVSPGGLSAATSCGLCPTNESLAGKIRLRARSAPTASIAAACWIEYQKEE